MISVIIPSCNEYPQILFTVQSMLEDGADEVIVISNKSTDKTNAYFSNLRNKKVKFFIKDDVLSHWQAKNLGIEKSSGDLLFFVDAHCIIGKDSFKHLSEFITNQIGGVHCIIHYILDDRRLTYEFRPEVLNYRFCTAPKDTKPFILPVMSTCGMMCTRKVIEKLGGWNNELGIYGGGESYFNLKHATCGYPHYVHPSANCWHYAEKRGYSWNYTNFVRNEFIMAYCVGGKEWLNKMVNNRKKKDDHNAIDVIAADVLKKCLNDREFIKKNQVITLNDYISQRR